jgi:hypothetical protein
MPADQDLTGTTDRPDPDREMDEDRAGDVRPSDGRPAAGTGMGPQAPDPVADRGELEPRSPSADPGRP